jgi:hypothetical protein
MEKLGSFFMSSMTTDEVAHSMLAYALKNLPSDGSGPNHEALSASQMGKVLKAEVGSESNCKLRKK